MYQTRSPNAYVPVPFADTHDQSAARHEQPAETETRTLLELRRLGAVSLTVACEAAQCGHFGSVHFERLGLPGATSFTAVANSMRFRCEACRGTKVSLAPAIPAPKVSRRSQA